MECVLTDSLFLGIAVAFLIIGIAIGIGLMALASLFDANTSDQPSPIIFCTKEDINDPDFIDRMYRAQGGNDGA